MDKLTGVAYGLVCLVVMILVIVTVALPVVQTAQGTDTATNTNTGAIYSAIADVSDIDYTLEVVDIGDKEYLINGESVTVTSAVSRVITDVFQAGLYYGTISGVDFNVGQNYYTMVDGDKITIVDGAFTFTPGATSAQDPVSGTVKILITNDTNGDYGMYYPVNITAPYISNASKAYVVTSDVSYAFNTLWQVTKTAATELGAFYQGATETGATTGAVTVTPNDENSYQIATLTLKQVISGNDTTLTQTDVFVPLKYLTTDTSGVTYNLLAIIPLMLLIVPLMVIIRMFGARSE